MMNQAAAVSGEAAERAEKTVALALRLAHAENALHAFAFGQIDAIVDPSGKTYLLHGAQEHLRRSEIELQALLESASDLVIVINRGGRIVSQNRAAERLLESNSGSRTGESFFDFVHPDDIAKLNSTFLNVIDGFGEEVTLEFRHRMGDGDYRVFEAMANRLRDPSVSRVVLICRDTTARVQAREEAARREAALVESARARGLFLATVVHELRTPLLPSLLCVDALLRDERFAEAAPELAMVRRNIGLQSRLLTELTDFIAIGRHKVRLRFESIDAHAAVRNALEICRSEIAAAGIQVSLDLHAPEYVVLADALKFQQIMWNLLKNAVKFSLQGGGVSITSANDTPGCLTLEFIDHGIGIEPALLPLVFDPFQQGDALIQHLSGGLGLGLFIAKSLAEAQHGTLSASSQGRGLGATFLLTLKTATPGVPHENVSNDPLK